MQRDAFTLEAEAQQVLDELWSEKLLPFALRIGKITKESDEYTIDFYDSRMPPVSVPLAQGPEFKQRVRGAVLACVADRNRWNAGQV